MLLLKYKKYKFSDYKLFIKGAVKIWRCVNYSQICGIAWNIFTACKMADMTWKCYDYGDTFVRLICKKNCDSF